MRWNHLKLCTFPPRCVWFGVRFGTPVADLILSDNVLTFPTSCKSCNGLIYLMRPSRALCPSLRECHTVLIWIRLQRLQQSHWTRCNVRLLLYYNAFLSTWISIHPQVVHIRIDNRVVANEYVHLWTRCVHYSLQKSENIFIRVHSISFTATNRFKTYHSITSIYLTAKFRKINNFISFRQTQFVSMIIYW